MNRKYVEDQGDWFPFTLAGGARQQCCGCGLTHDIEVRRKGRRYEMRILRHERATAAARRARKKMVVIAEPAYLNVLEHSERPPRTLHRLLSSKPEFFVEALSAIYRGKGKATTRYRKAKLR